MTSINVNKIVNEVPMDDGSRIVLFDMLAALPSVPDRDVDNNLYRLSQDGRVLWQVAVHGGSSAHTIYWSRLRQGWTATCISMGRYELSPRRDDGQTTFHVFAK